MFESSVQFHLVPIVVYKKSGYTWSSDLKRLVNNFLIKFTNCSQSFAPYVHLSVYFPRSKPAKALLHLADNHEIVLCDRNITELRDILKRKAPKYRPDAEVLLAELSYELIPAVDHAEKLIRDAKDQSILRNH